MERFFCEAKRVLAITIIMLMMSMIVAPIVEAAKKVKVTKVKLNETSITLYVGKSTTLKATVSPRNATTRKVTWKSSNTKIATVSSKGVVKGKKAGTVTITAAATDGSGKKATCKVRVIDVISIKIEGKTELYVGKSTTLKAKTVSKGASDIKVTWKSSDTKIATVSSKGVVKGKKAGTVTITATAPNGKKDTHKIKVIKQSFHKVASDLKKQIAKADINYKPSSFNFSKSTPFKTGGIDCSSYVSYVIYEYGKINNISKYESGFKNSKSCSLMKDWFDSNSNLVKKVGNLRTVANAGNLKEGDILINLGHVEMYSYTKNGNLYVFNCGSNEAIEKQGACIGATDADRGSYTVYRLLK